MGDFKFTNPWRDRTIQQLGQINVLLATDIFLSLLLSTLDHNTIPMCKTRKKEGKILLRTLFWTQQEANLQMKSTKANKALGDPYMRVQQGFDNRDNGDGMQARGEDMLNGTYGSMKGS